MSYICANCKKGTVHGRTQKHSRGVAGKRWKKRAQMTLRTFRPNLQKVTAIIDGKSQKMQLCASCISKFKKSGKIKTYASRKSFAGTLA